MGEPEVARVAGLLRVSTVSVEQSESPEAQLLYIREEIKKRTGGSQIWIDSGLTYEDELTGAIVLDRPGVRRLIADAKARKFDILAIKSIQRLGRDTLGLLHLKRILDDYGIELVGLQDGYQSHRDPELIFLVHADRAQAGREDISRNVRTAMRQRAKQGKWMAGNHPFGYRRKNRHELEPHPETASIVREIFRLRRTGWGANRIVGYLNQSQIPAPSWWEAKDRLSKLEELAATDERYAERLAKCRRLIEERPNWQTRTMRFIHENTAYYGELRYYRKFWKVKLGGKKVIENRPPEDWITVPCPPLITREEWEEAQEVVRRKAKHRDRDKPGHVYLLTGLLRCGKCGSRMNGGGMKAARTGTYYGYYNCQARRDEQSCDQRSPRADALESAVLRALFEALQSAPERSTERQAPPAEIEAGLRQIESQLADLTDQRRYYRNEHRRERLGDDELDTELARIAEEEQPLKRALEAAKAQAQLPDMRQRQHDARHDLAVQIARWQANPDEIDRHLFKTVIQSAVDHIVYRSLEEFKIHLRLDQPWLVAANLA